MEVILKEDVANLGLRGEVVKVADGFGRNYLLPRKLAMQATEANKAVIEQMKAAAERRRPNSVPIPVVAFTLSDPSLMNPANVVLPPIRYPPTTI